MNRLVRAFRQWRCDHRYHATGRDCPDCGTGFRVKCRRCGRFDWFDCEDPT